MILNICIAAPFVGACERIAAGSSVTGAEGTAAGLEEKTHMEAEPLVEQANEVELHPQLEDYVERVVQGFEAIAPERKRELRQARLVHPHQAGLERACEPDVHLHAQLAS